MKTSAFVIALMLTLLAPHVVLAGASNTEEPKLEPPGSEEAPGYEDFKDGDLSPREVEEAEERRDDRNIVSPGSRDFEELDREMGQE